MLQPRTEPLTRQSSAYSASASAEDGMRLSTHSALAKSPLFTSAAYDFSLPKMQRQANTIARAEAITRSCDFTVEQVNMVSERFWMSALHPVVVVDVAAHSLSLIQMNLAAGTLSQAAHKPEIAELCRKLLAWEISFVPLCLLDGAVVNKKLGNRGHFLLTEVGHGLDTQNLETTATLLDDGSFEIHTPHPRAAKFMPCTTPAGGIPRVAIVMARLQANGKFHGIRPFVVPLNDGVSTMAPGVSCRALPDRSGTRPMGNAITTFTHVRIPGSAFVGDLSDLSTSKIPARLHLLQSIWRLGVGTATLAAIVIPALRVAAHVTTTFARSRTVTNSSGETAPIMSFRTTQTPISYALAQAAVLEAFYRWMHPFYITTAEDRKGLSEAAVNTRNSLSCIFKTLAVQHWRETSMQLTDRLGARGLFMENQLISMEVELRGMAIAEGDVLVLCIRLATEYLLGRYPLPKAQRLHTLIAKHEMGIFVEMRLALVAMGKNHRSEEFNRFLLPRCVALVLAIGQRMAYEAALDAHVHPALIRLYEAGAVLQDLAWYVENKYVTRETAKKNEAAAIDGVLEVLDTVLAENACEEVLHAPILSDERWSEWVATLPLNEQAKL
ncbi:acyl-CoA oxidase [Mycena maculata]|uniref:Acyl-CoA oxidase n=1 Tax=Mycena maculata TaxID=230809 RepID=A0AAD7I9F0_9AGAR|nr:acyl-CoA oxidase [Mycena maculata]